MSKPTVLFEDNHLLVVDKPAGLATMGVAADVPSAVRWAAAYLKARYHKPGNVFVGVVSRLDSLVSGVLVLARTSKAAQRLSAQFREHQVDKRYRALVSGAWEHAQWSELQDWLCKDEARHRMQIVRAGSPGAQLAQLRVRPLAITDDHSVLEIDLHSGRKHQIRVQLAHRGHPILGDRKYGAESRWPKGIALHCHELSLEHPTLKQRLTFRAPLPAYWPKSAH